MRSLILRMFDILDEAAIHYLLLRPINFVTGFNDVDILVSKYDFISMIKALKANRMDPVFQYTNSNESLKMYINGVIFDIQFHICFLPYKCLILQKMPPYGSVRNENEWLFPDVEDQVLFTFWTHRFLLDKDQFSHTQSFSTYHQRFNQKWSKFILSDFFVEWTELIFGKNQNKLLRSYISRLFLENTPEFCTHSLRKLIIKNQKSLKYKIFFDQLKFKIFRRLGRYKNKYPSSKFLRKKQITFNFFPKKQNFSLAYSSIQSFHSKIFQNLYIQISSKNSLIFRLLKTNFILFIRSFFKRTIEIPSNSENYIGLLKPDRCIFFELKNNEPVAVWKKRRGGG